MCYYLPYGWMRINWTRFWISCFLYEGAPFGLEFHLDLENSVKYHLICFSVDSRKCFLYDVFVLLDMKVQVPYSLGLTICCIISCLGCPFRRLDAWF